jgi:hypothetical protein
MVSDNPEMANTIVKHNNIRYVIVSPFDAYFPHALKITYDGIKNKKIPPLVSNYNNRTQSMYYRLMWEDGSSFDSKLGFIGGLGNYRLLFESNQAERVLANKELSYYKIFEYVEGGTVKGKADPGSIVTIELPLRTSRKRVMYYRDRQRVGAGGFYVFHVPYATDAKQGDTLPLDHYLLTFENGSTKKVELKNASFTAIWNDKFK